MHQFSLSPVCECALWWTTEEIAAGWKRTAGQKQFQHYGHGQLPVQMINMVNGCEVSDTSSVWSVILL